MLLLIKGFCSILLHLCNLPCVPKYIYLSLTATILPSSFYLVEQMGFCRSRVNTQLYVRYGTEPISRKQTRGGFNRHTIAQQSFCRKLLRRLNLWIDFFMLNYSTSVFWWRYASLGCADQSFATRPSQLRCFSL